MSLFQPLPDLFLAIVLKTIRFGHAPFRIGDEVPIAFMGMWVIVFVPILFLFAPKPLYVASLNCQKNCMAGIFSLLIFTVSEVVASPLELWWPTAHVSVRMGPAALYVLIPEGILGTVLVCVAPLVYEASFAVRMGVACAVMLLYTGALAISYLVIETDFTHFLIVR